MPSWLVEDPSYVYLFLGLAAMGLAVWFWITRLGKYAIGLVVVLVLIVVVMLLDHFIVTDRERIVKHVQDMANAVARKDADTIFSHTSDKFELGRLNRKEWRSFVESAIRSGEVKDVRVWEFEPGDLSREKRTTEVTFLAKLSGTGIREGAFYRCVATFVLDDDGQWRMSGFKLYDPMKEINRGNEIIIPF